MNEERKAVDRIVKMLDTSPSRVTATYIKAELEIVRKAIDKKEQLESKLKRYFEMDEKNSSVLEMLELIKELKEMVGVDYE